MERTNIPDLTGKKLFDWLVANKNLLIAEKKCEVKKGDACIYLPVYEGRASVNKASGGVSAEPDVLEVKSVINTTNLLDSYRDVHFPGIWNKSLKENNYPLLLQEHNMNFDKVIADGADVKRYVKTMSWKSLGYDFPGNTQALIYESKVRKKRNPYMYEQYKDGNVRNHSVGMRYGKIVLCINDEDYGAEYEAWEKYSPDVVNLDEDVKWFWAVTEAKDIEGSPVVKGANFATPTLEVKSEQASSTRSDKSSQSKALTQEINKLLQSIQTK